MKEYILQRISSLKGESNVVQFPIERVINEKFNSSLLTEEERELEKGRESHFDYWRGPND